MNRVRTALIAPSGTFSADNLAKAQARATMLGFDIVSSTKPRSGQPEFLNGSLSERLNELEAADASDTDVIWAVRGGCGAIELWDHYRASSFAERRAPLIGYSDITVYHFLRYYHANRIGIHGPIFCNLIDGDSAHIEAIVMLAQGHAERLAYPALNNLNQSFASTINGNLVVMNLASLESIIGCFDNDFLRGKILALEDVDEAPYKVFRMMHHLKNARVLAGLKALIVGYFGDQRQQIIDEVMVPLANTEGIPLFDWPIFGHERPNWPLLFGAHVSINKIDNPFFTLSYNEQHDHRPIIHVAS